MSDCGVDWITLSYIILSPHCGFGYEFGGCPPSGISMIYNNTIENAQASTQNIHNSYDKTTIKKERTKKDAYYFLYH